MTRSQLHRLTRGEPLHRQSHCMRSLQAWHTTGLWQKPTGGELATAAPPANEGVSCRTSNHPSLHAGN